MDIKQALGIASRQGWLPKTPAAFRQAVLERCLLQQAAAGDVICRVGDPPGGLFSLVAGGLGVVISRQEKAPCVTHFARPGTWFGEACAITGDPRRVGLVATRATTLLHLPLGRLLEIIAHDPAAWRWLSLITLEHADTAVVAANDLMIRDNVKRVVAVILRLAGCRVATPSADSGPLQASVSQEEIGTIANVARNTAGSILKDLSAHGYVKLTYRSVEVVKPNALRAMLTE